MSVGRCWCAHVEDFRVWEWLVIQWWIRGKDSGLGVVMERVSGFRFQVPSLRFEPAPTHLRVQRGSCGCLGKATRLRKSGRAAMAGVC